MNREKIAINYDYIDTYDIAYNVVVADINLSLSSLADYLNVQFDELHRAEGDAYLSFQVFQSLIPYIQEVSPKDISLYAFLASKIDKQSSTIWELLSNNSAIDDFNTESYISNLNKFSQSNYEPIDNSELRDFLSKFTCEEFTKHMFSKNGPIANTIKDYHQRNSQLEMS